MTILSYIATYWEISLPSFSEINFSSSFLADSIHLFLINPVPAGINLPTITFSFKPLNLSTFPLMAASV